MQEEQAQLQSAAREGIPAPLPTLAVHRGTHWGQTGLTWNFQPHRSLQSSLGCHCPIPIKLKGISCLKPSRAFTFTGSTPLEFLHLDVPKEEDGTSLVDLGLDCRGLGVVFFKQNLKSKGSGIILSVIPEPPAFSTVFTWCPELPQAAAAVPDFPPCQGVGPSPWLVRDPAELCFFQAV